jgi:hypothetical protein
MDAFHQLVVEHESTLFLFYGYKNTDRSPATTPYFKLANSLSEALADLVENAGTADDAYFVSDAFLEADEEAGEPPTVHVELISANQIIRMIEEEG